ncbi:Pectinesterase [Forsythia ovata]|uniref:Pectinesterase n=1 Tax=Forsythia ovata TaxID=205694 RepID=A0ABD1TTD0_9LAMI
MSSEDDQGNERAEVFTQNRGGSVSATDGLPGGIDNLDGDVVAEFNFLFTNFISHVYSEKVLKRHAESQSPSTNSVQAIQVVCSVTRYPHHCIASISALYNQRRRRHPFSKTDPSMIFTLSLHVAINELKPLIQLPKKLASKTQNQQINSALKDCGKLLHYSVSQLNRSLISCDGKKSMANGTMIGELTAWIRSGISSIEKCLKGLEPMKSEWRVARVKFNKAEVYMGNSLRILENKNAINQVFYPAVQSIMASLMLNRESYVLNIFLICSQYLVMVFLICFLLRLMISRPRR